MLSPNKVGAHPLHVSYLEDNVPLAFEAYKLSKLHSVT